MERGGDKPGSVTGAVWCDPPPGYTQFQSDLEALRKKFPKVDDDLNAMRSHLEKHACEREGKWHNPLAALGGKLWKLKWPNTSKQAGKSKGLRLIYYRLGEGRICPFRFYDKAERRDLTKEEVDAALKRLVAGAKSGSKSK